MRIYGWIAFTATTSITCRMQHFHKPEMDESFNMFVDTVQSCTTFGLYGIFQSSGAECYTTPPYDHPEAADTLDLITFPTRHQRAPSWRWDNTLFVFAAAGKQAMEPEASRQFCVFFPSLWGAWHLLDGCVDALLAFALHYGASFQRWHRILAVCLMHAYSICGFMSTEHAVSIQRERS